MYTELDALTDVPAQNLSVYKEDSEPGEGKDPHWAEKGTLERPALIPASEEPVSMWSLLRQMSGKRSAESRFKEFPYRVGSTKWKQKWQLEAFTEVGKLPVPRAGQEVPRGPAGWAGVWRLRGGPSPLLKEE